MVTPDGRRPEGSIPLEGLKVYTVGVAVEKVTVLETRFAIAHSWTYRISDATIKAAPSTEAVVERVKSILGIRKAAKIPTMIIIRITSIRVNPLDWGLRNAECGIETPNLDKSLNPLKIVNIVSLYRFYLNSLAIFHHGRKTANARRRTTTPRKSVKIGSI